jgi:hypothetical protein
MMTGRRTDEIRVWDNWIGLASTNGNASNPDPYCVTAYGRDACVKFGKAQGAPRTFIDLLDTAGHAPLHDARRRGPRQVPG